MDDKPVRFGRTPIADCGFGRVLQVDESLNASDRAGYIERVARHPGGLMNRAALGRYIKDLRRRSGLTAKELAVAIARSETWLYRFEHGDRADPLDADLDAIATACCLTAFEVRYLYLLAGRVPPARRIKDPTLPEYLESINGPSAWLDSHGSCCYNTAFRRLFKGVDLYKDVIHWHFGCPDAHLILENWDEIAAWWVGVARLHLAKSHGDPMIYDWENLLLAEEEFCRRWRIPGLPSDPSRCTWYVHVSECDTDLEVDMRLWGHPAGSGGLLAGFVRNSDSPLKAMGQIESTATAGNSAQMFADHRFGK